MEISEAKRWVRLREWSEMIQRRMRSGQTVKAWCRENGICTKTYYYRLRSIRLATLQHPENAALYLPKPEDQTPLFAKLDFDAAHEINDMKNDNMSDTPAVTVRVGEIAVEISNGADPGLIASTLRMVREIC